MPVFRDFTYSESGAVRFPSEFGRSPDAAYGAPLPSR